MTGQRRTARRDEKHGNVRIVSNGVGWWTSVYVGGERMDNVGRVEWRVDADGVAHATIHVVGAEIDAVADGVKIVKPPADAGRWACPECGAVSTRLVRAACARTCSRSNPPPDALYRAALDANMRDGGVAP